MPLYLPTAGDVVYMPPPTGVVNTDMAALQNAYSALPARGGTIIGQKGIYSIDGSLTVTKPLRLASAGGAGTSFDGVSWLPSTTFLATTSDVPFILDGPVGMVSFENFAIDCANLAPSGIYADQWQGGGTSKVAVRNAVGYCLDLTTTSSTANDDTLACSFDQLYLQGGGLVRFRGNTGPTANCCHNEFSNLFGVYTGMGDRTVTDGAITSGSNIFTSATANFTAADVINRMTVQIAGAGASGGLLTTVITGFTDSETVTVQLAAGTTVTGATTTIAGAGVLIDNGDNNTFVGTYLFNQSSALGAGLWLGSYARGNYFNHLEASSKGVVAATPAVAAFSNTIFGYDQNNSQPLPTVAPGATLTYTTDGQGSTVGWRLGNKLSFGPKAGTDTSAGSAFNGHATTSGLAFTPGNIAGFVTDTIVYVQITGAASGTVTAKYGPTGTENIICTAMPVPSGSGALITLRVPAGQQVTITVVNATITQTRVETC